MTGARVTDGLTREWRRFEWTDKAVERLRELVEMHCSDSVMARTLSGEFGGVLTRNAVIGKRHRLKISTQRIDVGPATSQIKNLSVRKRPTGRSPTGRPIVRPAADPREEVRRQLRIELNNPALFECKPVTLLELDDGGCRWPVGELYCNNAALKRLPYCAHHTRRSYRTSEMRATA